MHRVILPAVLIAALPIFAPAAQDGESQVLPSELVKLLGDEQYPVREEAGEALWKLGGEAEEVLAVAASSGNPEIAKRARDLLRKIGMGLLPDSPPMVVALVERYMVSGPVVRGEIIDALKEVRAWRQVLKIHEQERDPATLKLIAPKISGVSVLAAREILASKEPDLDAAREFLEMGRPEASQLMALADFHRASGTLDRELERAQSLEGPAGHMWRYVLYSVSGQIERAAEEARSAGETLTAARLRLLGGDPLEWLMTAPVPEGEIPPIALDAYRKVVVGMWEGKEIPEKFVKELRSAVRHDQDDDSQLSLDVMFSLGVADEAEPMLGRISRAQAFLYYESVERVGEALEVIGLDPQDPDYQAWAAKRFAKILPEPDKAVEEVNDLALLGEFLERRGLVEVRREIFVPTLRDYAEQDEEGFLALSERLIRRFNTRGIINPSMLLSVMEAGIQYAEDDELRWEMLIKLLFGDGVVVSEMWDSTARFNPDGSKAERLRLMSLLYGYDQDRDGKVDDWWEWAWAELEDADEARRVDQLGLMLVISAFSQEAPRFLEVADVIHEAGLNIDSLGVFGNDYDFRGYEMLCLVSSRRWDEVAAHWKLEVEAFPDRPMKQAYLAGALRRAGEPEAAEVHDQMVNRLALGDSGTMLSIGQAYYTMGDFDRAAIWWRRAAEQSTVNNFSLRLIIAFCEREAKERGDWKMAASYGELLLLDDLMRGGSPPSVLLLQRSQIEMSRALSRLDEDREASLATMERFHRISTRGGSMADFFFPALRAAGLTELHDKWFEEIWAGYKAVLERFPKNANTMNTAAWTAARANRRLDEAMALVTEALEESPGQAAYLDTRGEIWFCRRDRDKAVEWSEKAVSHAPGEEGVFRQFRRFESGAFPVK